MVNELPFPDGSYKVTVIALAVRPCRANASREAEEKVFMILW